MSKYFFIISILNLCVFPLIGTGQPSWILEKQVVWLTLDGDSSDKSGNDFQVQSFNVEPSDNRYGLEDSSLFFSEQDTSGIIIKRDNTREVDLPYGNQPRSISLWYKIQPPLLQEPYRQITLFLTGGPKSEGPHIGGDVFAIFLTSDGSFLLDFRSPINGMGSTYRVYNQSFFSSEWNHIVVTIQDNRARTYLNGNRVVFSVGPSPDLIIDTIPTDYFVGGSAFNSSFNGNIDDIRIFNSSLTQEEVTELYQYESEGLQDTDRDGVIDFQEEQLGTNPNDRDTDGDGIIDGRELEIGTSPLLVDSDEDGYDDFVEINNKTDPISDKSSPEIMEIFPSIELNFGTSEGNTYQLQYSPNLEEWISYQGPFNGTGGKTIVHVSIKNTDMKYFRLTRDIDLNN